MGVSNIKVILNKLRRYHVQKNQKAGWENRQF